MAEKPDNATVCDPAYPWVVYDNGRTRACVAPDRSAFLVQVMQPSEDGISWRSWCDVPDRDGLLALRRWSLRDREALKRLPHAAADAVERIAAGGVPGVDPWAASDYSASSYRWPLFHAFRVPSPPPWVPRHEWPATSEAYVRLILARRRDGLLLQVKMGPHMPWVSLWCMESREAFREWLEWCESLPHWMFTEDAVYALEAEGGEIAQDLWSFLGSGALRRWHEQLPDDFGDVELPPMPERPATSRYGVIAADPGA